MQRAAQPPKSATDSTSPGVFFYPSAHTQPQRPPPPTAPQPRPRTGYVQPHPQSARLTLSIWKTV
ncbi:hypothetical protein AOQ84DRAFT_356363, partial [Glonium stellatum]